LTYNIKFDGINFGSSGQNQIWREEIYVVEDKFHFWREEIS